MTEPRFRVKDFKPFRKDDGLTDEQLVGALSNLARHGPDSQCADCGAVLFAPHKEPCIVLYVKERLGRIAAAPDLLEALREMVEVVDNEVPYPADTTAEARAAIAKATGDSP